MVTKTVSNSKPECFAPIFNNPSPAYEKYWDSNGSDECTKDCCCDRPFALEDEYSTSLKDGGNRIDALANESSKKPKSILINHENENVTKKPKSSRFVSFTLDDNKKPFTSSIYYGVKSYLHHFYEPMNKTTADQDSVLEDDFEFVIEPGRRRKNYWFFPTILIGASMLISAACLLIIGNVTPLKNPIVGVQNNLEILDQKAIAYNEKIETWQFLGLLMFCGGGIIIMLALLISAYEQECGCYNARNQILYPSLVDSNAWIRYAEGHPTMSYDNRIPLSEEVTAVQIEHTKN